MSRAAKWLVAGACLALAAGCGRSGGGRSDDDLGGLVHPLDQTPAPIEVNKAAHTLGELQRAIDLDHQRVGELIGPHAVTGHSHLAVSENGSEVESLDDDISIELDDKGGFQASLHNSRSYGRDVVYTGGWLYLRPRYGKYNKRRPERDGEPARMRSQIYGEVAAYFDLLAPAAALSDGGTTRVAGRSARLIKITTAPGSHKAPDQTLTQRKWREKAVVEKVSGEVALDEKTGVPLKAEVKGVVAFSRDGHSFKMSLEAHHELGSFGQVTAVTPPPDDQVVADIEHHHELDERDQLLQGIAPPARRAPTPSNPTGRPQSGHP